MKNLFLTAAASIGFAAASLGQTLPAYLPSDGLVGWWPFNGNANDESGNGNDGTVNGATLAEDRFGNADKAYSFDGVNFTHITIPNNPNNSLNLTQDLTISSWFNSSSMSDFNSTVRSILMKSGDGVGAPNGYAYGVWASTPSVGLINFQAQPNSNSLSYPSGNSGDVETNQWYNYIVTYTKLDSSLKYYLNGTLVDTKIIYFNIGVNSNDLWIGSQPSIYTTTKTFNGILDDIGIWNRALNQEEITALYNAEPINPPTTCNPLPANLQNGLVGYWPFCGNANDESGNGNDGTVNGATLTEDRFGVANSAYDFDGVGNYIQTNLNDGFSNQITIQAWLKTNLSSEAGLVCSRSLPTQYTGLNYTPWQQAELYFSSENQAFGIGADNSGVNAVNDGLWHHAIGVYDGLKGKIYVDGTLLDSIDVQINLSINEPFRFGNDPLDGFVRFFNGSLDDIGIWNRALTADEVQQLYTLNACTFTVYDTTHVTVYDTVTTYTTVTDTLIINTLITSLAPPANTNTIKVFPNPAGSFLTIDYGNFALMSGYQLRIENSLGQQVYQTNINQQSDTISLATWGGNGLYFVHIVDPQGNTIDIRKIVLQ